MSRWRREWRTLGLGADALVGRVDGASIVLAEPTVDGEWTEEELQDGLRRALPARLQRAGLRIALGPDLCKHWMHSPASGLKSLAELRRTVELRCVRLFGASGWALVADWDFTHPFACSAVSQVLFQRLCAAGRAMGTPLRVESAVLIALDRLGSELARPGWIAWHTPSSVVVARGDGRRLTALRCARHGMTQGDAGLRARIQAEWRLDRLILGTDADETLNLPCGEHNASSASHSWLAAAATAATDAAWSCVAAD